MKPYTKGVLLTITSAVLFGLNPLLSKMVYRVGCNAATLALARVTFGALFFLGLHCVTCKATLRLRRQEVKKLWTCAIGYALTPVCLLTSYNYLSTGLATIIHFVYPVFVLLGCVLFQSEKLNRVKTLCCGLCLMGLLSFYTPGGQVNPIGVGIDLISAIAFASYIIALNFSGLLDMPHFKLSFWLNCISIVIIGAVVLLSNQFSLPKTAQGWAIMLLYAGVAAAAVWTFQVGNQLVGPQSASLLSTFEPLTSVIIGVIVYSEPITVRSAAGIAFILVSAILLSFTKEKTYPIKNSENIG